MAHINEGSALHLPGAGGTSGGMGDDWKDSVNTQLAQLHNDVRNLLYGLLAAIVLLAGAGWSAYAKLSDQITELKVGQAEAGGKLDLVNERLGRMLDERDSPKKH